MIAPLGASAQSQNVFRTWTTDSPFRFFFIANERINNFFETNIGPLTGSRPPQTNLIQSGSSIPFAPWLTQNTNQLWHSSSQSFESIKDGFIAFIRGLWNILKDIWVFLCGLWPG
ncbi:MAG: hypothetical protein AAB686_01265 [Patescibacteria group bacterium]